MLDYVQLMRTCFVLVLAAVGLCFPGVSIAQVTAALQAPPETVVNSPGGVDMVSGRYRDETEELSIGSGPGAMNFVRINEPGQPYRSNWHYSLSIKQSISKNAGAPDDIRYSVRSKGVAKSFISYSGGPITEEGLQDNGISRLEKIGTGSSAYFLFTGTDGTKIQFESAANNNSSAASSLTRPDGSIFSFTYDNGGPSTAVRRLRRVASNTGFVLILEYTGLSNSQNISKACLFNAATVTPPSAHTCPAAARAASFTHNGSQLATITNPLNQTTTISYSGATQSITKPGHSQPWIVNTTGTVQGMKHAVVLNQSLADGRTFSYTYEDYNYAGAFTPSDVSTARSSGWTENGQLTTGVVWASSQPAQHPGDNLEYQPPTFISPAPASVTDPIGRITSNAFYGGGVVPYSNLQVRQHPSGRTETFTYSSGSLTQRLWDATPGSGDASLLVTLGYDCAVQLNCYKPAGITDARGNTTNYTYDPVHGGVLTETGPAAVPGGVRPQKRTTYQQFYARYKNSSGVVIQAASPVWLPVSISECATQASCAGTADETRTTFTYGPPTGVNNLLLTAKTVATGDNSLTATTSFTYDSEGNKLSEDGPQSGTVDTSHWRYDALRRVVGTIAPDPDGAGALMYAATRTTFDAAGRAIRQESGEISSIPAATVAPAGWTGFTVLSSVETDYDLLDRKTREVAKGSDGIATAVTQYSYDAFGRLECTAVRMNPAVFASLPTSACTLGSEGAQGPDRITRNVYDNAGQLLRVQKAYGTALQQDYATYTYTPNGKQASVKDANGNLANMTYDGHDRQKRWIFPSKTSVGSVDANDYEEYGYDANGNRTSFRKRDGSTLSYQYDALNRNTVKVVPERAGLSATHTRDVHYGYDLRGLQTYARFDSASGEGLTFAYDGFGRLTTTTQAIDGASRTLTAQYDVDGNRTQLTYPDGNYFAFGYDGLDRMTIIGRNAPSGLTGYGYNTRGLRSALASGSWTYYGYDPVGRLNSLNQDIAGTAYDTTYSYGYNPASQLITQTTSNDSYVWTGGVNVNRAYAVNGLNQYASAGPASFSYDANGNLTGDGSNAYVYDVENRLVSASGASSASLRYDPLGRLYETTGASGTTRFLYDGDELVAEYNNSGTMLRRYVHGSGVDDPMAWFEGAGVGDAAAKLIKTNHQGSVIALTDWWGNLTNINSYDEWGIPATGNTGRFQYTGQAWIPELGMYYYKARIYSPTLGRFMQTDPIGYKDQMNLYAYVGNDPVNKVDPSGKEQGTYGPNGEYYAPGQNPHITDADRQKVVDGLLTTLDYALSIPTPQTIVVKGVRKGGFNLIKWIGKQLGIGAKKGICCFVAGTLVDTEKGLRPIEEIAVGDKIWARDEVTGETALKEVTNLIRRHERIIWSVSLTGPNGATELFETTDDHPWWISGQGWKTTAELKAGMAAVTRDGRGMIIASVVETRRTDATYNLTVADFETYFVGKQRVLVHNCPGIYKVPGERTSSGKGYVGQTGKDSPDLRAGNGRDGRVREAGDQTTSMPGSSRREREIQEQREINAAGGIDNLDNQRNSVDPKKWEKLGIGPPK